MVLGLDVDPMDHTSKIEFLNQNAEIFSYVTNCLAFLWRYQAKQLKRAQAKLVGLARFAISSQVFNLNMPFIRRLIFFQ